MAITFDIVASAGIQSRCRSGFYFDVGNMFQVCGGKSSHCDREGFEASEHVVVLESRKFVGKCHIWEATDKAA